MVAVHEISWEEASAPGFEHTSRQAFRAAVQTVADKAKVTLPECHGRVDKAVQIVLAGDVELLPGGHARVASQCQGTTQYHVVNGTCDCADFPRAPSSWCKHRLAAGLHKRATALVRQPLALPEPAQESVPAPAETSMIPSEFVTLIHGKKYVQYGGLLTMAHQAGLVSLKAAFVSVTADLAIATATATFADGRVFEEAADSTPDNVTKQVRLHFARMALVRAKSRCLRDALNIPMTALEELEG